MGNVSNFAWCRLHAALVLVVELAQAGRQLAATGAGAGDDDDRPLGLDHRVRAVSMPVFQEYAPIKKSDFYPLCDDNEWCELEHSPQPEIRDNYSIARNAEQKRGKKYFSPDLSHRALLFVMLL